MPFFMLLTFLSDVKKGKSITVPSIKRCPGCLPISSPSPALLHGNGMPFRVSPPFWVEVANAVFSGRWQEQYFYSCPKILRKWVQKEQFRTPYFRFNSLWKASALRKQSLKVPEGMKKLKHGSEIKSLCPYLRVLSLGISYLAPSLK